MIKTKITNHQLFTLVAVFTIGTSILSVSSNLAGFAKQDAWISSLIAQIIGLAFIFIYFHLGKICPGKTLVEMLKLGFGKWAGWIISIFFVIFVCFQSDAQVISYVGGFIQTEYMTETPLYALNFILVVGLVIGLLYGLEAIARSSEIFIVLVTSIILITILLSIPNIDGLNLLPILEGGITPVFKGSLNLSSYMTWPLIVIMMIYPTSVEDTKSSRKAMLSGYIWGASLSFICTIMAILVLGSTITARSNYPTYLLAQEINIGIITRIEGIVSGAWIITQFIRILLYFYAGVIGFSQLFGLKDYKKIVLPIGLVLLVLSGIVYPTAAYQTKWDSTTWIPFIGTFGAILPIVLLVVLKIKSRHLKGIQ